MVSQIALRAMNTRFPIIIALSCWLGLPGVSFGQFGQPVFPGFPGNATPNEANSGNSSLISGTPLDIDRNLKRTLNLAEEDLAAGNVSEALERWQLALGRAKNNLTTRDEWKLTIHDRTYTVYRSVTDEIERRLAKLPPRDLNLYRQTYDTDARLLLKEQGNSKSTSALERLVDEYFISSYGDEAAFQLAIMWFDQGDYARSARLMKKILTDYPGSNVSPKQLHLRLTMANLRMRDLATARTYWNRYVELTGDNVPDRIQALFAQELALAANSPSSRGSVASWPMSFGGPGRDRDMPNLPEKAVGSQLSENWEMPFETQLQQTVASNASNQQTLVLANGQVRQIIRSTRGTTTAAQWKPLAEEWRNQGWMPARNVYFHEGLMYINGNGRVICCDAETGKVRWMGRANQYELDQSMRYFMAIQGNSRMLSGKREPSTNPEIRLFADRLHPKMTIHEDVVYALEGKLLDWGTKPGEAVLPNTSYSVARRRSRSNNLAAYDAISGKVLWSRSPDDKSANEVENPMGFLGAPVPFGDNLLIPVCNRGELWLYSLERETGKTAWKVFLWDDPQDGSSPWTPAGTALEGGDFYLATGMGMVFALDASTGKVHWAARYPRKGFLPAQNRGVFNPSVSNFAHKGWREDVAIPHGNQLVVFPSDADHIIAFDRRNGMLLWDSPQVPYEGDPRATYCVGVSGDGVIVGGNDIVRRYDIPSGKLIWEYEVEVSLGEAAITSETVYVPSGDSIVRLNTETGQLLGKTSVFTPTGEPVGNLVSDGRHLYGVGLQRVYALASLTDRLATLDKSIAQGDGQAQLTRMRIHLRQNNFDAAVRDLQEACRKILKTEGRLNSLVALYEGLVELDLTDKQPVTALQFILENHPATDWQNDASIQEAAPNIRSTLEVQRDRLLFASLEKIQENKDASALETVLRTGRLCTTPRIETQLINTVTKISRKDDKEQLTAALQNEELPTQLAAAEALLQSAGDQAPQIAETLLGMSSDRMVLKGARVLANEGQRDILPRLASLMESDTLSVRVESASILRALTKQNFRFTAYDSAEARQTVVRKWKDWIASEGQTAELVFPLQFGGPKRGRTLYTNYNANTIYELDEKGNEVWKKTGVSGPWACQGLANGHRLVSSYRSRSIHEFDENGKEVWKVDGLPGNPFSVQRLHNGNTLVSCSNSRVLEYTPEGKIAREIPLSGIPRSAERLENGNTLITVNSRHEVIEVNAKGDVVWRVQNMQGPIAAQRLPNGNTVIANYNTRQIVEVDTTGKQVWSKSWSSSMYDMQRLENGNTLIVDLSGIKEIDRDGKVVSQKNTSGVRGIDRY